MRFFIYLFVVVVDSPMGPIEELRPPPFVFLQHQTMLRAQSRVRRHVTATVLPRPSLPIGTRCHV